ncbi:putative protein N(5)-glutamine methyltransferase [Phytoactinopolyspora halotolerans]|uniref:putative protein N(5)-glutamine methyltransferase n=1 Tax=Phytoactinopolyspora halotolerans TaxID=1981512 RepID=UPI001C20B4F4|nr:putative protein N(5)-glutamine methyltransferase [Phytoactinopolyspora halotolerans]
MVIQEVARRLRSAGCVFADDEARLLIESAAGPDELDRLVRRRAQGEPLEHVVGWAEFCGLRIAVEPGVFVPRRRTEFLVDQAGALLSAMADRPGGLGSPHHPGGPVLVDLCCGSAAIGVAVAARFRDARFHDARFHDARFHDARFHDARFGDAELHAADVDAAAVRCARRNVAQVGGQVYRGDLFQPLPDRLRGQVDLLLANTPYVPTGAITLMPAEARLHEPRVALDGGPDGLDVQRRVAADVRHWLRPGGHVLVETGRDQTPDAVELFSRHGLHARSVDAHDAGGAVVIATLPSA